MLLNYSPASAWRSSMVLTTTGWCDLVPCDGFHEPLGIGGRPQQVDSLLPGVEVRGGHEHDVPALGVDPHRHVVVVDLLNEGKKARAGLAVTDRHGGKLPSTLIA
jgi:hypothetical protein